MTCEFLLSQRPFELGQMGALFTWNCTTDAPSVFLPTDFVFSPRRPRRTWPQFGSNSMATRYGGRSSMRISQSPELWRVGSNCPRSNAQPFGAGDAGERSRGLCSRLARRAWPWSVGRDAET